MSAKVVVRRLGLSIGRQLLVGTRGRSLVGAVSAGFPQALDRRWFSSDSQPKYSKEYFDGVRGGSSLHHNYVPASFLA